MSHIYAHLDLAQLESESRNIDRLDKTINGEAKQLDDATLDREILQLRQQDYGIKKIAKTLGCSVWRVRKCLKV